MNSEMTIDYSPFGGEITGLLGCNLVSNLLPDGYAVESAHLSMKLTGTTFGNQPLGFGKARKTTGVQKTPYGRATTVQIRGTQRVRKVSSAVPFSTA